MFQKKISLEFNPDTSYNSKGKHVRDGLSSALKTGNNLWICCDERSSLERLSVVEDGNLAKHAQFNLDEFLDIPGGKACEIDIEGLGTDQKHLWLVGSHSLARKKPNKNDSPQKQIKHLAKVKEDANRYILAKIPLLLDPTTGEYELVKKTPDPEDPNKMLHAAQLNFSGKRNRLFEVLEDDEHFKHFMKIPGKDNGFDIEGLAVHQNKIYLGVRGPVLRGWAVILEVQIEDGKTGFFDLKPVEKGKYYKKHFLHLNGMGIRDLRILNHDLLILAGPTMDLDGTISVFRWTDALIKSEESVVHRKELSKLFDVAHGFGENSGKDKAEGMALYDANSLLIVFDSPADARKTSPTNILADVFDIPACSSLSK